MASKNKNLTNAGKGRKPGQPNKITRAAKEAFQLAFEGLGGVDGLIKWGRVNRTDFYRLYGRLLQPEAPAASLVNINMPNGGTITNASDAAAAYALLMGNPHADMDAITFALPEPTVRLEAHIEPLAPLAIQRDIAADSDTVITRRSEADDVEPDVVNPALTVWERLGE
jgi:hypothetical protein